MAINVNKNNQYNNWGESAKINREWASFAISESSIGTADVGKLLPVYCRELIPGQKINVKSSLGVQFMPFVGNLLQQFHGTLRSYFVPYRLIDPDNWEDFIQGGIDGKNTYSMPFIDLAKVKASATGQTLIHTVLDYLGYPVNGTFKEYDDTPSGTNTPLPTLGRPSAYPVWAYNKIYNDQIRPVDLQPEEVKKENIECLPALWQWDYFTRGRVYQQRGEVPIVPLSKDLPLRHSVKTILKNNFEQRTQTVNSPFQNMQGYSRNGNVTMTNNEGVLIDGRTLTLNLETDLLGIRYPWYNDTRQELADHDFNADGIGMNLNDLLVSMGLMSVLINNAKITYRYIDFLEQRFGIKRQDSRLQLAEYIKTETFDITTEGIVQTSYGDVKQNQTPQGYITAQASGVNNNMECSYEAQEHGIFIQILAIVPATMYEQGLPRLLQTKSRFEFVTPELVNMPARETKKGELYFTQTAEDNEIFNWNEVYAEYRTSYNRTTGLVRPSTPNGLPWLTLCRNFNDHPVFNLEFLQVKADMDRIVQYPNEPDFYYVLQTQFNTAMPLPLVSNPAEPLTF